MATSSTVEDLAELWFRCDECGDRTPHHFLGARGKRHPKSNQDAVIECLECGRVKTDARINVRGMEMCEECGEKRWFVRQTVITGVRRGFLQKRRSWKCSHCGGRYNEQ